MTPTEQRVKELIESWLTSIDLHMQYADLNDSAYNKVQPWPIHDRPSKWVLEMTRQKVADLQSALEWRIAMGDAQFADTLEQAILMANLVGLQNPKRFIPLATPQHHGKSMAGTVDGLDPFVAPRAPAQPMAAQPAAPPVVQQARPNTQQPIAPPAARPPAPAPQPTASVARPAAPAATPQPVARPATPPPARPAPVVQPAQPQAAVAPRPATPPPAVAMPASAPSAIEATREMPRLQRAPAPAPVAAAKPAPAPPAAAPKPQAAPPPPAAKAPETDTKTLQLVMEDAIRLINWGRSWHELPEAVARLADRPKAADVRRILRTHRAEIEQRAKDEAEAGSEQDKKKKKKR